jgi:hypothetical protein
MAYLRRNLLPNITNEYIASCTYNPITHPYCPVFMIRDIINEAEPNKYERDQIFLKVIIRIDFNFI